MVLNPALGDEGVPATVERVSGFIQERGGEVTQVDQWGKRRLAYPIRSQLEAYYVVTQFKMDPQAVRALAGNLELAGDGMRHLGVRPAAAKKQERPGGR